MNPNWLSFKQLDEAAEVPKGEAFRAFRRLEQQWRQDRDYRLLRSDLDAVEIAELKRSGQVYRSSANVVLLAPARAEQLLAILRSATIADGGASVQQQQ